MRPTSNETAVREAMHRAVGSVVVPDHLPWREALARRRARRRRATQAGVAAVVVAGGAAGVLVAAQRQRGPDRIAVVLPAETVETAPNTDLVPATIVETTPSTVAAPGTIAPVEASTWTAVEDAPFTIGPAAVGAPAGDEYVVWDGSSPTEQAAAWSPARGWRTIAESPLSPRTGAMAVPAGDRLIIWGGTPVDGDDGSTAPAADEPTASASDVGGAIYDPATDAWTPIPSTTATGTPRTRDDGVAVWTGTELLVWASNGLGGRAAAYDPATGTWRTTSPAPIAPRSRVAGVWTGTELVVWGGTSYDADGAFAGNPDDGAAYDPATDTWRVLPPAPMAGAVVDAAWTGSEVLFTPGYSGEPTGIVNARAGGGSYDPATDTWSAVTWLGQHPASTIVAVEHHLLIMAKGATSVHDLADGSTVELPWPVSSGPDGTIVELVDAGIDGASVASLAPADDGLGTAIAVGLLSDQRSGLGDRHLAYLSLP